MKIYLAGPMSGYPAFNIPAFDAAAQTLRSLGFDVISPAEIDGPVDREILLQSANGDHIDLPADAHYGGYLGRDVDILLTHQPEAIVTLPGWKNSRGARIEVAVAEQLGMQHLEYADLITTAQNLAGFAHEMLSGAEDHGPDYQEDFESFEDNPERQRAATGAVKDNRSKSRVDLLPGIALIEIGKVLGFGARKYKPNNWRLGLSWLQTLGSIERHLLAWENGEDLDPETGISHIAHAGCQVLFLLTYVLTGTGDDDRWSAKTDEQRQSESAA